MTKPIMMGMMIMIASVLLLGSITAGVTYATTTTVATTVATATATDITTENNADTTTTVSDNIYTTIQMAHAQESKEKVRIDGAGASFAFPLMDLWRVKYSEINPHITLNYQSIGSGGGIKQHIEKTVNFAASDAPLKSREYEKAPGSITIPEMIGAISIAYNLPGVDSGLKLTGDALCGIYLGDITQWDDPKITQHNPDIEMPNQQILAASRSDGSGTTFALTSYLTKICPKWDKDIGAGKSVPWPAGGRSAPGNEGVAGLVKSTEGAIGYITLAYAFQEDMTVAAMQNGDKTNFVMPTLESASDASNGAAPTLPKANEDWGDVDLLAAPGDNAYPITSFSYIVIHPELEGSVKNANHAKETVDLIAWIITDGQKYNADLLYVPISKPIQNIGLEGLSMITYQGEQVYTGPTSVEDDSIQTDTTTEKKIPAWVKTVFEFYANGGISDSELIVTLQYLIQQGIIEIE